VAADSHLHQKVALVTMNPIEASAVRAALAHEKWFETQYRDRGLGRIGYSVRTYESNSARSLLDHVDMDCSGNITAGLVAAQCFVANGTPSYDAIILFGCAGRNPVAAGSRVELGEVVLVALAQYAENGKVVLTGPAGEESELVTIKTDRLRQFQVEMAGGLTDRLRRELNLKSVRTLCCDKVMRVDPAATPATHGASYPSELGYTELLAQNRYEAVDMESFGFLWALPLSRDRVAVLRVLTDDLVDHESTTEPGPSGPSPQATHLEAGAAILINVLGLDLRSPYAAPPPTSSARGSRTLIRSLIESLAASLAPGRSKAKSYRELLTSMPLIASEWADPSLDYPAVTDWLSSLVETNRKGYGGRLVSDATLATSDELVRLIASTRGELVFDESDAASAVADEHFSIGLIEKQINLFVRGMARSLDPTLTPGRYRTALRTFLAVHDAPDSWQVLAPSDEESAQYADLEEPSEVPHGLISQSGRLVAVCPKRFEPLLTSLKVFYWNGLEDDATLVDGLWQILR